MIDRQGSGETKRLVARVIAESHFGWPPARLALDRTMMPHMCMAVSLIGVSVLLVSTDMIAPFFVLINFA
jgi:hypothetical protein